MWTWREMSRAERHWLCNIRFLMNEIDSDLFFDRRQRYIISIINFEATGGNLDVYLTSFRPKITTLFLTHEMLFIAD